MQRNENNSFSIRLGSGYTDHPLAPAPTMTNLTDSTLTEPLHRKPTRLDKLSDRAKLGSIIVHSMKLGEALSDRMAVQLIVERLR